MSDNTDLPSIPDDVILDLNSHEQLLNELQDATNEVLNAAEAVNENKNLVQNHNLDASAHPDIRQQIEDVINSGTTEVVDTRIADHNQSPSAHLDIRNEIAKIKKDTTTATEVANQRIEEHNSSATAHSDIREIINGLKVQIGSINLTEVITKIDNIQNAIKDDITKDIEQLQSVDARHDNEIATNRMNITSLSNRLSNLSNDISTVSSQIINNSENADRVLLQTHCLDREAVLGYEPYNPQGPFLQDVNCTLPIYVSHNKTTSFIFTGAKDVTNGNQVTISITQGKGDYTITPLENIKLGDPVNMNVGGGGAAGSVLDFTVTFTDGTNHQVSKRVYATMLAKPLSQGAVSINNLPTGVEPGSKHQISISNLSDVGDGRYKYSLDVKTSGIVFSKTSDIIETDRIDMTIPEEAERERELAFDLIAHDTYGSDITYNFSVYVNALPDVDDFTHNVPGTVIPNGSYTIQFDGILSASGKKASYNIVKEENAKLTFSKYQNILANENVTMKVDKDVTRGKEYTFKIRTQDENSVSVEVSVSVVINILPLSNDISTTLPAETQGGKTLAFKISGGSDENQPTRGEENEVLGGRTVTSYEIDAGSSSFNFSKTSGISSSDEVQVTLPKVMDDSVRTFNIYAVDNLGERSLSAKVVTITLLPIYLPVTPTITAPTDGTEFEYDQGIDITWTEFQYTTDIRSISSVEYTY